MDFELTRGKQPRAQKVVLYGQHGIGKSTLASMFPDPVFIDTEDGTYALDVARLPKPLTWTTLLQEIAWASTNCAGGTLVIDSVDWAERLCTAHVLADKNWDSIESPGYGKGYVYLRDEFSRMLKGLDMCVAHGVNCVLVAHDQISTVQPPDESSGYTVYGLKLSKHVAPLVKEWCDALIYCRYRVALVIDADGKAHAKGGSERVMVCNHSATIDAKNRWGLPDELPMAWESIAAAIPGNN